MSFKKKSHKLRIQVLYIYDITAVWTVIENIQKCWYIDYVSVERISGDPGIDSLEKKSSDLGCPAWFLSINSHSKLLTVIF